MHCRCHFLVMLLGVLKSAQLSAVCMLEAGRITSSSPSHVHACLSVCAATPAYALQVSFLAYAFGGGVGHQLNFQPKYQGRDLAFMHSHMVEKGLTMDHFDAVLRHFCQTLRQLNMPQVRFCCLVVSSSIIVTTCGSCDWIKLDWRPACTIRVMCTKIIIGQDPSHKPYLKVLAQTLHICFWGGVAACRHPETRTINPQPICSRH